MMLLGDERQHLVGDAVEVLGLGLLAEDGEAGLELGRLDVGDEAPLEAAAEPVLEGGDRLRRPVGGDHDLAAVAVELVERVEELLLELLGALEELDVVDEQHVEVAVAALERRHRLRADRSTNSFMNVSVETYRTRLLGNSVSHVVADGVQQVGLAEAGGAVDEQRVVRAGRRSRRPRGRRRARSGSRRR